MAHFERNNGLAAHEKLVKAPSPYKDSYTRPGITKESSPYKLLEYYLSVCRIDGKSQMTIDTYQQRISACLDFTKGKLTTERIRIFLLELRQQELSATTINAYYRAMHAFCIWLCREEFIKQNPMQNMKPPRIPKKVIRSLTTEEINRLMVMTSGKLFFDIRNRAIILLLLDTGIRLAELTSLKIKDINIQRQTIHVHGKGNKERIVHIGKTALKAVLKYLQTRSDDLPNLWLTEGRKPLGRWGIKSMVYDLFRYAEIDGYRLGPHTFRHTAAVNYLRNGGDVFTLQRLLGHSTLEMTKRYLSSLNDDDIIVAHTKYSPVDNMKI